jgi:outer membrane biosynthesis protein TonB
MQRLKVLAFPGPKHRLPDEIVEEAVAPEAAPPSFGSDAPPPQYDRITVRAITVAIVLSLLVHFVVLLLPAFNPVNKEMKAPADEIGPLSVTIAQSTPPPAPQPKPEPPAQQQKPTPPTPTPTPQKPIARQPQPRPKPQVSVNGNQPPFVVPPPVEPTPTPEVQPQPVKPTVDDFAETLAARQAARRAANGGAPDEVVESDNERANRIAKANVLGQQRSASPGQDPDQAGGIFDLRHTGVNDAEFVFNGWNHDFRRTLGKTFEVKTGNNPDIRIAVIRQMIAIIREQRPTDFEWHSHRLGKVVTMSARPQDQPELELFLMKEFYPQDPRSQAH